MRSFLLVLAWSLPIWVFSQHASEYAGDTVSLKLILEDMEDQYDVRFSYVDEAVAISVPDFRVSDSRGLDRSLQILEVVSGLRAEQVNQNYIVIRPFEPSDEVSVCGRVVDDQGKPMFGLLVKSDLGKGTITDAQGAFSLTAAYGDVLNFQHVGYQTKRRMVGNLMDTACVVLAMKEAVSFLEALTIREFLTVGISKYQNQVSITPKELVILPGLIEPDVLQGIQQTPGVVSPYETASGLHVRGGSPDQNLVLWNGIKTYNQGHFFGMLSAFNPYITEEVKFIKNGTSAKYGGRVSSVVDIRTSEEVADDFSGGAGFNMLYGDAFVQAPVVEDQLSVMVSGRRSYTDLVETPTYNQYAKRVFQNTKINDSGPETNHVENDFYFSDFNTSVIFQPNVSNRIITNTLYYKNDLDFSTENDSSQTYQDKLLTQNEGYSIKWLYQTDRLQITNTAYYANYLLNYQFISSENDTTSTASKKNLINDVGYNFDVGLPLSERYSLKAGYQLSYNRSRYAFEDFGPGYSIVLDQDDQEMLTHSAYAEVEVTGKRLESSLGFRGNYYAGLRKFYVEPRLYAQYRLTNPLYVNASAEYKTQVISQIKESVVSDLSLENQVWKLASSDRFPVIDSYQYTTGFGYSQNDWDIDLEGYWKSINGVTSLTFGFLNPVDDDYRQGRSEVYGLDFFVKKQVERYKSWVSYSYIHTRNTFKGLNDGQPFPGNWNIEHQVNWSHFYQVGDFHFSLGWIWHTGKSYTDVREESGAEGPVVVGFDELNGENLPVYHRLDFSAVYNFRLRNERVRYRIGLSVLNAYNRRNLLNREFRTTPSLENELIDTRIYSLGITPNLVFRMFW